MAKGNQQKPTHVSMRGKNVDMDLLRKRNELTPAVGNARVNARGDELGPGGQIIRKADDKVREHYKVAGKARSSSGRAKPQVDVLEESAPVAEITEELTEAEQELLEEADSDEWVEDEDGNFVPRSEA
jgi:hypothetical protein